jgi:hypothetical protein
MKEPFVAPQLCQSSSFKCSRTFPSSRFIRLPRWNIFVVRNACNVKNTIKIVSTLEHHDFVLFCQEGEPLPAGDFVFNFWVLLEYPRLFVNDNIVKELRYMEIGADLYCFKFLHVCHNSDHRLIVNLRHVQIGEIIIMLIVSPSYLAQVLIVERPPLRIISKFVDVCIGFCVFVSIGFHIIVHTVPNIQQSCMALKLFRHHKHLSTYGTFRLWFCCFWLKVLFYGPVLKVGTCACGNEPSCPIKYE